MMRSAGAANTYSVSLEKNIGYTTAIGEVTRESGSVIGNSLKSIYSRITSIQPAIDAMADIGINIKTSAGEMRSVEHILDDLGGQWSSLNAEQQQNLGLQVAGRFQLSRFLILMNQYDTALQASEKATNSAGSGYRENAEYLKSYSAQINQVKNAWTETVISARDSGLGTALTASLKIGVELLQMLSKVIDVIGVLPFLLGATSLALLLLSTKAKNLILSLGSAAVSMGQLALNTTRTTAAVTVANPAVAATARSINVMSTSSLVASANVGVLSARAAGASRSMSVMSGSTLTAAASVRTLATSTAATTGLLSAATLAAKGFMSTMLLASLPIAGFMLLGAAIAGVTGIVTKHIAEQKELEKSFDKYKQASIDAVSTHKDKQEELVKSYTDLAKAREFADDWDNEKEKEYLAIQQELGEIFPALIKNIDSKGQSHLIAAESIEKEVAAAEKLYKQEQLSKLANSESTYKDKIKDVDKYLNKILEIEKSMTYSNLSDGEMEKALSDKLVWESLVVGQAGDLVDSFVEHFKIRVSTMGDELIPALQSSMEGIFNNIDITGKLPEEISVIETAFARLSNKMNEAFKSGDKKAYTELAGELRALATASGATADQASELTPTFQQLKDETARLKEMLALTGGFTNEFGEELTGLDAAAAGAEESIYALKSAVEQVSGVSEKLVSDTDDLVYVFQELSRQTDELADGQSLSAEQSQILADTQSQLLDLYPHLSSESLNLMNRYEELSNMQWKSSTETDEQREAYRRLIEIHPALEQAGVDRIGMIQAIIANIEAENQANDLLLAANIASAKGNLTAQEESAKETLKRTNERISIINTEIRALNSLAKAYAAMSADIRAQAISTAQEAKGYIDENEFTQQITRSAEMGRKAQQALSTTSSLEAELATNVSGRSNAMGILNASEAVLGNTTTKGNKARAEAAKATKAATDAAKKNTKAAKDSNDAQKDHNITIKESIFLTDTYKKALESLNLELSRINQIKSQEAEYSKKYQSALKQELVLLEAKKDLEKVNYNYIKSQIATGNVAQTGVVTSGGTGATKGTYTGKYATEINRAASKYGVEANLIAAVIQVESSFNPNARSGAGAQGLMQLMPGTARGLGVKNSYNAAENIDGGVRYLAQQIKAFGGDINMALAAYNAGPGNVRKYGGIPPFKETQNHIVKVNNELAKLNSVTKATTAGNNTAAYYLNNFRMTSGFGKRDTGIKGASTDHQGADFAAKAGTSIKTLRDGKVVASYYHNAQGHVIRIQQDDGAVAQYQHMQKKSGLKVGQAVTSGQEIGKVGSTGISSGAHLHLEIKQNGKKVDPIPYLKAQGEAVSTGTLTVAENLQDLDALHSELIKTSENVLKLNEEIRAVQKAIIETELAGFNKQYKIFQDFLDEEAVKKDRLNLTSERHQRSLKRQLKYMRLQQDVQKQELAFLDDIIKNGKLSNAVKEEMIEKANELRHTLTALATALQNISYERLNARQKEHMEYIAETVYELERSRAIMGLYEEGTIEYNKELENQIVLLEKQRAQIVAQREALQNSLLWHDLTAEQIKEVTEKIRQLGIEYWNLGGTINSTNEQLKVAEDKFASDLADKLIQSYKDYIGEKKTMHLKSLDDQMKAEDARHKKVMDNLKDELDGYRKIVQAKIDAIDKEESDADYNKEMGKLGEERLELMKTLNLLSMDDSLEAKSQRKKLQEDLDNIDETIADKRHKREVDLRKESLNELIKDKEDSVAKEEELENKKHDATKENIDKLKEYWSQHYDDLANDERKFAQLREDIMAKNFDNISIEFKDFLTELENTMPSLENTMDGTMKAVGTSIRMNIIDSLKEALELMSKVQSGGIHSGSSGGSSGGMGGGVPSDSIKSDMTSGDIQVLAGKFLADKVRDETPLQHRKDFITDRARKLAADGRADSSTIGTNVGFDDYVHSMTSGDKQRLAGFLQGQVLPTFSTPDLRTFIEKQINALNSSGMGFETGGYTGDKMGMALLHKKELVLNEGHTKEFFKMGDLFRHFNSFMNKVSTPDRPSLASNGASGDVYEINFNVDKMTGNEADVTTFTKQFQDRIKRNKGRR